MAADQRRKRLNGASIVSYGSREQQRAKRKNLGLMQHDLRMKSHITVEWDSSQKRVVAKQEQIGITWRQMKPFFNFVSNDHNVLADVLTVPKEFFDLDNLKEVLSYKVWKNHLSENERNLLVHFLPHGLEPHQVVEELLAGNNIHFGNPFLKWGASLCSGDLHPDVIVDQERHLKSEKRAYYSQLHNYHNDMIGFLVKLKERWQSCKDPEKDIVQKIWRSKNVEKRVSSNVNDLKVYDHDGNFTVTSESCSWDAEEKEFSCDNQIFSVKRDEKLQRSRVLEIGSMKGKSTNLMVSSDDVHNVGERLKKGDKLSKRNIHSTDGDKYMSCIKISKQQHELVKSMKQSGRIIQSKTLNRVLGNLDNIHVQPYEVFVKEEQNKLHEHWLELVNKALPAAYANWMERHRQRHAVINSLLVEVKEKSNPLGEEEDSFSPASELQDKDETNMSSGDDLQDQDEANTTSSGELPDKDEDDVTSGGELQDKNEDDMKSSSGLQDSGDDNTAGRKIQGHDEDDVSLENELQELAEDEVQNDKSSLKDEVSVARTPENQSPHDTYGGRIDEFNSMSMKLEKNLISPTLGNASQNKIDYPGDKNTRDVSIDEGRPFNSSSDVWQAVEMPHPFFDTAGTHEYTTHGLSLANPRENEERACLIDLEAGLHQEETGKELLHRQLHDQTFSSYQSQGRSDLLQSFLKGDGVISYHHEQKGSEMNFQASNNVIMGDSQLSSHFKDPLQTSLSLDQGQRRANEVYTSESMPQNIYSNGGRYLVPRQARLVPGQDSLAAVNMPDWSSNTARTPSQSHLNTADFSGHHWFPADQVHGGWNGSDGSSISSHSLGTATNSDQSLFSILSQCNQLHPRSSYDSFRNTDDFLAQRPYGVVDTDTSRTNAVAPQASHPLEYFSGREAPSSGLVPDDMAWMSLPHQNDQMGKPYLRSWNR
ncbi:uncharacterized protein LOC130979470 isoform X1 [Arachis stenosperma]|uniref:uncharacterized protein LOC130979470 isoform X1 n=1 Tax=Arachis stenosperma TaxID=217475 RepID=UPI0025ABE5A1|nr:uncharacterized protein LOC130979470 isoform X1 [Arachis stenosperma]XP_057758904.1 uncharacterized protein LOC130979470 isoform X1 [Arachis stenosperma]